MQPGSTTGHYNIIRQLGKGGKGGVYLVDDTKLKREVAIKVLPESVYPSGNARGAYRPVHPENTVPEAYKKRRWRGPNPANGSYHAIR
jgi:serine/threonine protein kinase